MVEGCRSPACRLVAIFADIIGAEVRCAFALRLGAIMAASAIAGDAVVIEDCWSPPRSLVAIRASIASCQVGYRLACCLLAIVA